MTRNPANAEELVQEAAMLAFRKFDTFRSGTQFKAWFMQILKNCFLMDLRNTKRKPETIEFSDVPEAYIYERAVNGGVLSSSTDPAAEFFRCVTHEQLTRALRDLPEEYRLVAVFHFVDELTYQETAELLEIPMGTVRSRLHRARRMLQRLLWSVAKQSLVV
jgi:RNA polymerase sigma-70 factor (ECF subfamily)